MSALRKRPAGDLVTFEAMADSKMSATSISGMLGWPKREVEARMEARIESRLNALREAPVPVVEIPAADKILAVLKAAADSQGLVRLDRAAISRRSGVPHGSVHWHVRNLEAAGEVVIEKAARRNAPTVFRIPGFVGDLPPMPAEPPKVKRQPPSPRTYGRRAKIFAPAEPPAPPPPAKGESSALGLFAYDGPKGLLELHPHACRWPLGERNERPAEFCAKLQDEFSEYCPEHTKVGMTPAGYRLRQDIVARKKAAGKLPRVARPYCDSEAIH